MYVVLFGLNTRLRPLGAQSNGFDAPCKVVLYPEEPGRTAAVPAKPSGLLRVLWTNLHDIFVPTRNNPSRPNVRMNFLRSTIQSTRYELTFQLKALTFNISNALHGGVHESRTGRRWAQAQMGRRSLTYLPSRRTTTVTNSPSSMPSS